LGALLPINETEHDRMKMRRGKIRQMDNLPVYAPLGGGKFPRVLR
jgi:hypothetical protein